ARRTDSGLVHMAPRASSDRQVLALQTARSFISTTVVLNQLPDNSPPQHICVYHGDCKSPIRLREPPLATIIRRTAGCLQGCPAGVLARLRGSSQWRRVALAGYWEVPEDWRA